MDLTRRDDEDEPIHVFVSPYLELNVGLWLLFFSATAFLALRVWVKINWRHGLWYDDYILIVSWWMVLLANNSLIIHEFRTGYILHDSSESWDDRMHILINISSCGTLIGQSLTKTAFGVTLLRISNRWQRGILWFCIATMNAWMIAKVIIQWAKVCGEDSYDNWYRLDFCIGDKFRDDLKEGGNVYNIIMDFVFATFPWLIFRRLDMQRMEKIGLSLTMSLGIIVAVVSAIRVAWKDNGNDRDKWYIYRNGVSQVWYSSEITGTILVQCIPILRTVLRDMHSSFRSKRLSDTNRASSVPTTRPSIRRSRSSYTAIHRGSLKNQHNTERVELTAIPEGSRGSLTGGSLSVLGDGPHEVTSPNLFSWHHDGSLSITSPDLKQGKLSQNSSRPSLDEPVDQGLWPPPRGNGR